MFCVTQSDRLRDLMSLVHKVLKLKLTYFGHVVRSDGLEIHVWNGELAREVGIDQGGDGWTR